MNYGLPTTLTVNGREEPIRWEYTAVLDAIAAMDDPELEGQEKVFSCLYIIYENFEKFSKEDMEPAFKAATEFINNGLEDEKTSSVRMIDFEQDFKMMVSAINKVAGKEIRGIDGIHWWTFLSWFMEIGECTYSTVLTIRDKKRRGKPLEKWEKEFYASNKRMVDIQPHLTDAEKEAERKLNELLS